MYLSNLNKIKKLINPRFVYDKIRRDLYVYKARQIFNGKKNRKTINLNINQNIKIFFTSDELSTIADAENEFISTELLQKEKQYVDSILKYEFSFLSQKFNFNNKLLKWDYDPITCKEWPKHFALDISYKGDSRVSDIKIPWEFAKMQYLFIMGRIYQRTGDKKYINEIINHITSFIDYNKPFQGIHWISALEVGMRVISWIMIYPFIKNHIGQGFTDKFLNEIYYQSIFIEKTLSNFKHANTHLIGESLALMMAGMFLDSKSSKRWYRKGKTILIDQIYKQTHLDGVHKEQSISYHRFFLDYYLMFVVLHKINFLDYPEKIDQKIKKMVNFVATSIMPSGNMPNIGDADDARGIYLHYKCENDYLGIIGLSDAIFNIKKRDSTSGIKSLEHLWLYHPENLKFTKNPEKPKFNKLTCFDNAGYYIIRERPSDDSDYLFFDCGPLCMGNGAHGHADALSFLLCKDGEEFLTDTGTYSYNLDYNLRDYFRSTKAHNTVSVDGLDQSEIRDRMSYNTFAQSKITINKETEHFVFIGGIHNGYERLPDPVRSHRYIFFDNSKNWFVFDYFEANDYHVYKHHLHLDLECSTIFGDDEKRKYIVTKNNKQLFIRYFGKDNDNISICKGVEHPERMGWMSKKYCHIEACQTLVLTKKEKGEAAIITGFTSSDNIKFHNLSELKCHIFFKIYDEFQNTITYFYDINDNKGKFNHDGTKFTGRLFYYQKRIQKSRFNKKIIYAYNFTKFDNVKIGRIYSDFTIQKMEINGNTVSIVTESSNTTNINYDLLPNMNLLINGIEKKRAN